jgi:hypothetical protein
MGAEAVNRGSLWDSRERRHPGKRIRGGGGWEGFQQDRGAPASTLSLLSTHLSLASQLSL